MLTLWEMWVFKCLLVFTLIPTFSISKRIDLRPKGGQIVYAYNITCLGKPVHGTMKYFNRDTVVATFNLTGYHNKYFLEPKAPSTIFLELKYKCNKECYMYNDQIMFDLNIAENGIRDMELSNMTDKHEHIPCDFGF